MNLLTEFKTKRLFIREPALTDAGAIFSEYASDKKAVKYMTWKTCTEVNQVYQFLEFVTDENKSRNENYWVITLSKTDQIIGMISTYSQGHKMSFGYILGRNYWNQGYMTEALKALLELAFSNSDIFRVWATCDTENKQSMRVMEKCGLKKEGILNRWVVHPNISKEPRDSFIFAITR